MENSNWHNKTRRLVFDGKPIMWTHLLELQDWDQGRQRVTPGLQLVPKLSFEHLHLTPGLRMKVNLAAQWLREEFLVFINKWEREAKSADIPKKEQNKLCLSQPTLDGLRITVNSFLEMVPYLLGMEGVEYFLSGKFSQDCVEEFFAKQRAAGGSHDNPTVEQFGHFMLQNYVAGSRSVSSVRANVSTSESPEKATPLPRRKRKSSQLFE